MIMFKSPLAGSIVVYDGDGNKYRVDHISRLKDGDKWVPCIVYSDQHSSYVRRMDDFMKKFKKFEGE